MKYMIGILNYYVTVGHKTFGDFLVSVELLINQTANNDIFVIYLCIRIYCSFGSHIYTHITIYIYIQEMMMRSVCATCVGHQMSAGPKSHHTHNIISYITSLEQRFGPTETRHKTI